MLATLQSAFCPQWCVICPNALWQHLPRGVTWQLASWVQPAARRPWAPAPGDRVLATESGAVCGLRERLQPSGAGKG